MWGLPWQGWLQHSDSWQRQGTVFPPSGLKGRWVPCGRPGQRAVPGEASQTHGSTRRKRCEVADGESPPTGTQVPVSQPGPQLGSWAGPWTITLHGCPATGRGGPGAFLLDPTTEGKGLLGAASPVTGSAFATTGSTWRTEDGFGCT